MAAEFEFHARLFKALENYIASHKTNCEEPIGEEQTKSGAVDIYLPSLKREGVAIEVKKADVDPHDIEVIRQGHRYARDKGISLFATANPNDVFLFRRKAMSTSITELERRHYDLRELSLDEFIDQLLTDIVDIQQGEGEIFEFDDLIVSRLRSFHTSIYPLYEELIKEKFDRDDEFQDLLQEWAQENDYEYKHPGVEDTIRIAAQQYAYLLMNRVVFYELVRKNGVETDSGFNLDPIYGGVTIEKLDSHLRDCFDNIMGEIDYEAIFRDDSKFFRDIPESQHTKKRLHSFTKSIQEEPLRDINVDVVGQIYQKLIPTEERKELGQFYTPDEIGTILSRWAIDSPEDRFLDPCSGSGSITVEAYKQLDKIDGMSHQEIIRRITAVDINKFPLHLTALNLATRDIHQPTNELFAYYEDFFHLDPDTKRQNSNRLGVRGEAKELNDDKAEAIGTFDATAANPPYVRQKHLYPSRDMYRQHLKRFGPGAKQPYYDGDKEIDGRSDLYCYFLTHVTQFLNEGGKLAWIVPTKWMTADYGPSLQQFLYDHYKIEAVVGFRKRIFEDALVDTVLLMMERCDNIQERKQTDTNFIRINKKMDTDDVIKVINRDYNIPEASYMKIHGRPNYRTISVRQSYLMENIGEKIYHYISAPPLYTAVLEHKNTAKLSEFANITRGKKTGANPIFLLDEDMIKSRGVEARFLSPAIKGAKEIKGYEHISDDAEKWMLDMHDYVKEVISMSSIDDTSDLGERVTSSLRADGYSGVLSYIRWAEKQNSRQNNSLEAYDPWFDMGDLSPKTAPIICPQAMDTRRYFFRTDENIVASNRFLLVQPTVDENLLLGLLNSSLTKIVIESHGRVTGGGAVNLSGSDLKTLRVVDPTALTNSQAETIKDGFNRLVEGDESGIDDIDKILIDVLDLNHDTDELQKIAEALKITRRKKGQEVEPLIDDLDELEGNIEMSFEDKSGRQQGLSNFGDD